MVYWKIHGQFSLHNELLLFGNRIVIPSHLRKMVLTKIHHGIQRCQLRLFTSVWWPGASKILKHRCKISRSVARWLHHAKNHWLSLPLPAHPWETIAADLFKLNGTSYLLVVNYFSRFSEVVKLTTTTSIAIIQALKPSSFFMVYHLFFAVTILMILNLCLLKWSSLLNPTPLLKSPAVQSIPKVMVWWREWSKL